MPNSKMPLESAARLFLVARGRGGDCFQDDHEALTRLLLEAAISGHVAGILEAKDHYRALHPGLCRLLSRPDCDCFLCCCDKTLEAITRNDR